MASDPITSMQIEAEIVETVTDFISWAPKSLCLVASPCRTLCQLTAMASQLPLFTGILQARIVVWIAIPSSRGLPNPGTEPRYPISFTVWATSEALDSILKKKKRERERHHFADEGPSMVFPAVMYRWELDHKEDWAPKNWCFQIMVLEKTPESPLDNKETKPINSKGNQPLYSLEGLILKLKLQYFSQLTWRIDSMEKIPLLGKTEGKRRRGQQRMKW